MKITFLIGNGFDIGLGMNTRYEDFYKVYCDEESGDSDTIKEFKEELRSRNNGGKKLINWSDFEFAFGQYSETFEPSEQERYLECFDDFVRKFKIYLGQEEEKYVFPSNAKIGEMMFKGINNYYQLQVKDIKKIQEMYDRNRGVHIYNFISFNYTRSLDKCVEILREKLRTSNAYRIGKVYHAHGYIDDGMIMGVNDSSQIKNESFAVDEKINDWIIKSRQNDIVGMEYDIDAMNVIETSDIICIYGMSLGVTDKKWWETILQWLDKNGNHRLVLLQRNEQYDPSFPGVRREVNKEIMERLLSYSNQSDEVKQGISERIHLGVNFDKFALTT